MAVCARHDHPVRPPLVLAALATLSIVGLTGAFDVSFLQNDAAHYVSMAKNLLDGHGTRTSIVWTAEHHLVGGIPVVQTGLPPGYPALIALVSRLGLDPVRAALVVSVTCFGAVPFLVYWLLRSVGQERARCLLVSGTWFFLPIIWFNVLALLSEMNYTLVTLLGLACVRQSERRPAHRVAWLVLAGIMAGLSFLVRYAGIVYIASLSAVFLFRAARRRDARSLHELVLVAGPPAAFVVAMFARNYWLTGKLVGGLVPHDNRLADTLLSVYWAVSELVGLSKGGLLRGDPAELLMVVVIVGALGLLLIGVRVRLNGSALRRMSTETHGVFSLTYVLGAVVFLVAAAKMHASGEVQARYLLPLIPFGLLLVPYGRDALRLEAPTTRQHRLVRACGWLAVGVLLAGQVNVADHKWQALQHTRYRQIDRALQQPFAGGTVRDFLRQHVTRTTPLLGNEAPLTGAVLDRPVVGLPSASYTAVIWTADETRRVVAKYGIGYVVFFPHMPDPTEPEWRNQVFFRNLETGTAPPWLERLFSSASVRLYRVVPAGA